MGTIQVFKWDAFGGGGRQKVCMMVQGNLENVTVENTLLQKWTRLK